MEVTTALDFVGQHRRGLLLTLKRDGRPQASNIAYSLRDGVIRISLTADRAKTRNVRRDPRVSLHVTREDFYAYAVIEGDAELSEVTVQPGDEAGRLLREVYEHIAQKPHPDWNEFDQAMVSEQRLVLSFRPTNAYGMLGR